MWAPGAVFVGTVLLIIGAYYLLVVKEEGKLIERLRPRAKTTGAVRVGVLKTAERMSAVGPLQTALERSSRATGGLQRFIEQSGLKVSVGVILLGSGCLGLLAYLVTTVFTGIILFGLLAGVIAGALPYLYLRRARTKRIRKFEEQFPEAIDLIARALRAGHALPTGLEMVADELPPPVSTEFRALYDEQNFGLTLPEALKNFAGRVPVLDARFFVTAVLTQREAGGNLAEVLDHLAQVIRERFKVKRQVRVISAHGRITGWVLAFLPPSVAVASFFLNPSHLRTLMGDPLGVRMIQVAVVMQIIGTLAIRKLVDIEY
jgi:tight adherence protein B